MKSCSKVFRKSRGRSEASGDQIVFLKCTIAGKGMQKSKMEFSGELGRTSWLSWFSSSPNNLIYDHCLPFLISLVQEQTAVMSEWHQDGKSLEMRAFFFFFFGSSRMNFIHMCCYNLYRFLLSVVKYLMSIHCSGIDKNRNLSSFSRKDSVWSYQKNW